MAILGELVAEEPAGLAEVGKREPAGAARNEVLALPAGTGLTGGPRKGASLSAWWDCRA